MRHPFPVTVIRGLQGAVDVERARLSEPSMLPVDAALTGLKPCVRLSDTGCMVNARDFSVIEKLLAPEVGAMETVSRRLRDTGHDDLAERVMNAKQTYVDECHAVRREFTDRERSAP